jgi:hypothetical protein
LVINDAKVRILSRAGAIKRKGEIVLFTVYTSYGRVKVFPPYVAGSSG